MPRKAREKYAGCIYHVICRSVSEYLLFRDNDDKSYYLGLLKRYIDKYKCSLYAYCLMDNHLHLHLDPKGYDISKFMLCTNVAYVRYYNRKYNRHGPVFQERFESRILTDDEYNLAVSAYIHNNPKDMEYFKGREHLYEYSSYGIYLGVRKDLPKLLDLNFIMDLFSETDPERFRERYKQFVSHQKEVSCTGKKLKELESVVENEYRSGRQVMLRNQLPGRVLSYVSDKLLASRQSMLLKSKKRVLEYRAFCAYVMRVLCGLCYREICENMYNITVSGCSKLCSRGHELVCKEERYRTLFIELAGKSDQ